MAAPGSARPSWRFSVEIERGVLNPLDHGLRPGSRWWRDVNEDFLLASERAVDVADGLGSSADESEPVRLWLQYMNKPSRQSWYRAHNGSIAAGYLARVTAAADESGAEQKPSTWCSIACCMRRRWSRARAPGWLYAIIRMLFGHATLMANLESLIADSCGPSVNALGHLPYFYPRHYPLSDSDIQHILDKSHGPEQDAVDLMTTC